VIDRLRAFLNRPLHDTERRRLFVAAIAVILAGAGRARSTRPAHLAPAAPGTQLLDRSAARAARRRPCARRGVARSTQRGGHPRKGLGALAPMLPPRSGRRGASCAPRAPLRAGHAVGPCGRLNAERRFPASKSGDRPLGGRSGSWDGGPMLSSRTSRVGDQASWSTQNR
jgi:hypothetical protein